MRILILTILSATIFSIISGCGEKNEVMADSVADRYIAQGDSLFDNNKKEDALEIYKMAADTAMSENNNSALTEAYSQVARCYLSMDKKDEGRPWLDKAEKIAKDSEPNGWTRYLGVKGRFLWKDAAEEKHEVAPEVKEAGKVFSKMYDYAMKHKQYNRAIDAANMMGIVGDIDKRVEWSLKAIKAAEEGGMRNWLAALWNNLGWTYDDLGMYDKSLEALIDVCIWDVYPIQKTNHQKILYHYIKGDERSMLIADWSVTHAFRMTGQIDSAFSWGQKCAIWAKDIYDEDRSPESAEWLGMSYKEIGETALADGNEKRALAAFRSARMYLDQAGMKDWDEKGYNDLLEKINKLGVNINRER